MYKLLTSAALGLTLAAVTTAGVATPADAQRFRGGYHGFGGGRGYRGGYGYRRGGGGGAVVAGILGLGIGAAIASDRRGYGYAPGYYGYAPGYYAYDAYAPPPYAYGGYCHSDWRWDGYRGRYDRVRFCD